MAKVLYFVRNHKRFLYLVSFLILLSSCKEEDNGGSSSAYDPNKPVTLESFTPTTGGMATRIILSGSNLGNDPAAIKVYLNQKLAPIVGCDRGKVLVITPRQPGDTCVISVVVGKDSLSFTEKFTYNTNTVVSTVVGQKGTNVFKAGSFGEATFHRPAYLTVDDEGNLFLSHHDGPNCIVLISQQNRTVTQLIASDKPNAPSTDITGKVIVVPLDPTDGYYEFDPLAQWAPRRRAILHPSIEEQAAGIPNFTINAYKHSFAVCMYDSMVYTRSNRDGYLVKFNPKTRLGQQVKIGDKDAICGPFNTDSYIVFDPVNKTRLYCACSGQHCIYYFDILTGETGVYAGKQGSSGWRDGKKEDAQFNSPRQMILDINNNLVIADQNNHCIRRITPEGNVETVVGIAGKSGYQDGNPDDALFNQPWGLAIDNDYTIYVADYANQCIRKLTIE
jgi:hypothetical protein